MPCPYCAATATTEMSRTACPLQNPCSVSSPCSRAVLDVSRGMLAATRLYRVSLRPRSHLVVCQDSFEGLRFAW